MKEIDKQKVTCSYIQSLGGECTRLTLAPVTKQSARAGWIPVWNWPAATVLRTAKVPVRTVHPSDQRVVSFS